MTAHLEHTHILINALFRNKTRKNFGIMHRINACLALLAIPNIFLDFALVGIGISIISSITSVGSTSLPLIGSTNTISNHVVVLLMLILPATCPLREIIASIETEPEPKQNNPKSFSELPLTES
ncbi:hypothetical protein DERP_010335 [Dermatophagoides pteronyssinus]|uniref:Uncharacterized protein n=1 Tax=Dermatophagoides pteronyssinus TaxID=6956 RepID=A0ABQ8IYU0_DERPT|nr:hypothetical protein DERP_010335 [Dermatophagoides pteronyssinus]